ncbi:MAG: hypothetical protein EZS28_031628 [Streblomastix strix]|uniref:Uncharacterized protein n=1 Tax=Streblomastix strix TaxID=222440 RepID=A0A5J4USV8_9EUKA|nr:MAG: hypothetical protein EZS28_031628 [Streblomastix strix]
MHTKFIIASLDWIFNGWLLVVQNISTVIETILVEESPLASALLNVGVQGLYVEYVILKSPMKRISGNQLGGVYLWVTASGSIASLILTHLNALSSMDRIGLKHFATPYHSVHSHQESAMIPLSQSCTITQSSERYLYLKSSSSSLTKTCADNPRDSFEIPYINDYPTYVWAYDLSSHPELLMATYPLKSNTRLNKSVVKPYKIVSDLDQSLMYLQNESLAQSVDVLKFTDSLYASFLHKEEFIHGAEIHIGYAFFLQDFRPAMLMKLLAQSQKACEYFPGWISRWIVYRLMRQAEEWMESGKVINQKQNGISESGAHSENPNILREYSVLMRDLYGDDRLGIEMLCEADLMEQDNKIDLLKNEYEL